MCQKVVELGLQLRSLGLNKMSYKQLKKHITRKHGKQVAKDPSGVVSRAGRRL